MNQNMNNRIIVDADQFIVVKVARNEDLAQQIGKDFVFDLVNHDKVGCFRVEKQLPFYSFKESVAKEFGIPVQFQRFWIWAKRKNFTYRPDRALTHDEEAQSIEQLRKVAQDSHNAELKLFLEVEHGPLPELCEEHVLIFFKLYDPAIEQLRYVGRLLVKSTDCPSGILMKLNEMAGFLSSQEIELYEEINFEPSVTWEPIVKELPFHVNGLGNGDIVCFQKTPTVGIGQQYRYPDVPSYLEYIRNRQVVYFRPLEKLNDESFCLEISNIFDCEEVVKKVACHLGVKFPSTIRLTYNNRYTQKPGPPIIKNRGSKQSSDMLVYCNQISYIIYYEVLEDKLFTIIKVARNEDLAQQIGRDICFDLVNHDKVQCFCIMKEMPFNALKEEVAKEFGVPVRCQRYWIFTKRENLTYRPFRPVTHKEETKPIGELRMISQKVQNAELKLFLQVDNRLDFHRIQPPEISKEDILIFFKLYDPAIEQLRYVGQLLVKGSGYPSQLLMKLNEMAGFQSSQEIELYEEVKFEPSVMCEPVNKELTFQANMLQNGDIVCFQKTTVAGNRQQYRYSNVPSYLEYVHNRVIVHFRMLEEPTQAQFSLELSKLDTYEEIATRVASRVGVNDPLRIRLRPQGSYWKPLKYDDILYYQVLTTPVRRDSMCALCLVTPLEGACLPCGHFCGCMSCLNKLSSNVNVFCPLCRRPVNQIVRIYVSS